MKKMFQCLHRDYPFLMRQGCVGTLPLIDSDCNPALALRAYLWLCINSPSTTFYSNIDRL
jgi:hypothetical protein